ncbi:hypothetical protein [Streptomyces sp. NPDC057257]|uniref:hypothetical protein n=1 Tax=Streptomyces sp. NPDC057257 TaxID=3346071 RepID=UPI0036261FA7
MPAFNRPPEWQQQADRHTELVDPVLTVRQLGRFDFNLKSLVRIDHALVFATPKGGYDAYLPPRRPTRSEIAAKRYTAVYEVDMGVHPFTAELALPSDNDAFEFTAAVELSWQVLDPARFVASGHRDVPALVLGELQQAARPVSRRFGIADSADAERELLQAVTVLGPLGAPVGLQVTWTLRLRRDQENIDHQRRLQAIDHSAAEQIRAAERGMEIDVEVDRRDRQQDRLQIERAASYGHQQQELILQQQRWQHEQAMLASGQQHELALQQGHQMLELQRIEAEKINFYQWHLSQGGVQAWALHLAQHPEDSRLVMQSMREDQLRMIQAQMDLVGQLLSGDQAENYELEGPKQLALRTVSDILNQRLPGVAQSPPLLPPPGDGPGYPGPPDNQPTPGAPTPSPQPMPGTPTPPWQTTPGTPTQPRPQPAPGTPTPPSQPMPGTPSPPWQPAPQTPPQIFAAPAQPQPQHPVAPGHETPATSTPQPPGPYAAPAAAQYPQPPAPTPPAGTPSWQPPAPYTPPPNPYAPSPQASGPYPGAASSSPASGPYPGAPTPSPAPPQPPAWQPPPGYGSSPTLPVQPTAPADAPDGTPQDQATDPAPEDNSPEPSGT